MQDLKTAIQAAREARAQDEPEQKDSRSEPPPSVSRFCSTSTGVVILGQRKPQEGSR